MLKLCTGSAKDTMRWYQLVIDDTGSVEGMYAFIYCSKWRSGQVSPMPYRLTLKDRATQLLIKYRSSRNAILYSCTFPEEHCTGLCRAWFLPDTLDQLKSATLPPEMGMMLRTGQGNIIKCLQQCSIEHVIRVGRPKHVMQKEWNSKNWIFFGHRGLRK